MKKITYPLFLAALSSLAVPEAANAVCLPDSFACQTDAGSLNILEYEPYEQQVPALDPITGEPVLDPISGEAVLVPAAERVSIASTFTPSNDGQYAYISAIISGDAPTIFFDGTPIDKPLLDPPPGGYLNTPPGAIDLKPYYDTPPGLEEAFPGQPNLFGDRPGGSLNVIQAIGGNAEARFETWLVEVLDEEFGDDSSKAQDDIFTVNPLIGFQWGYDIKNTDNGDGVLGFEDFLTTTLPLTWLTESPTGDWMTALDRVYGIENHPLFGDTRDRFNVVVVDRASVPEPSSVLGLIGLGILGAKSVRKRKA